ncbi:hypothetical protein ACTGVR_12500, partial [Streptococcus suis]
MTLKQYIGTRVRQIRKEKNLSQQLNRTPKVRQKKSNIWGAIFMKLSYEDKIEIYELRQSGQSIKN